MSLAEHALFGRFWRVQVDKLDISALDIEAKILTSIKAQPNRCALTFWNMNAAHRAELLKRNQPGGAGGKTVGVPVEIEAGYEDNSSVLFSGDLRELANSLEGTDGKTTLAGDDGGRAYREGRINITYTKGTGIGTVLKACADAMSIGVGNAYDFAATAQIDGIGASLPHTMTLSGNAAAQLTRVTQSCELTWSIQRGALQLQRKGKPLEMAAIKMSPSTGLIGSPQSAIDASVSLGNPQQFAANATAKVKKQKPPKDPGVIKARHLLVPGLVPGRKVALESRDFSGGYMITEAEFLIQSWAKNWYVDMVLRLY